MGTLQLCFPLSTDDKTSNFTVLLPTPRPSRRTEHFRLKNVIKWKVLTHSSFKTQLKITNFTAITWKLWIQRMKCIHFCFNYQLVWIYAKISLWLWNNSLYSAKSMQLERWLLFRNYLLMHFERNLWNCLYNLNASKMNENRKKRIQINRTQEDLNQSFCFESR